jgi:formate dehydrogenase major subunit
MMNSPRERLRCPPIRENGGHRPASWDEALDRVARSFQRQLAKHGPDAFGMFSRSETANELNHVGAEVRTVVHRLQSYR